MNQWCPRRLTVVGETFDWRIGRVVAKQRNDLAISQPEGRLRNCPAPRGAIKKGARVVLVDDLLATGGTAGAATSLIQKIGGNILETTFLIELSFLNGRDKLKNAPVRSIIRF